MNATKNKRIKLKLYLGIFILTALFVAYFVSVEVDSGSNYIINTSLLAVIIFYNPFILGLYILIAAYLIYQGLKEN